MEEDLFVEIWWSNPEIPIGGRGNIHFKVENPSTEKKRDLLLIGYKMSIQKTGDESILDGLDWIQNDTHFQTLLWPGESRTFYWRNVIITNYYKTTKGEELKTGEYKTLVKIRYYDNKNDVAKASVPATCELKIF